MQGATGALLIALLAAAIAQPFTQDLQAEDVKIAASDMRSAASTTRQVIEQYQRGEITERYYRAHIQLLEDQVSSQFDSLNTPWVDDAIRDEHASVRDLTASLDDMLKRLEDGRADLDASRTDALQLTRQFARLEATAARRAQTE